MLGGIGPDSLVRSIIQRARRNVSQTREIVFHPGKEPIKNVFERRGPFKKATQISSLPHRLVGNSF